MKLRNIITNESRQRSGRRFSVLPKFHSELESACPICHSRQVLFSKFQGILELTIFRLLSIYPFWCNACDTRFYLFSKAIYSRQGSELR